MKLLRPGILLLLVATACGGSDEQNGLFGDGGDADGDGATGSPDDGGQGPDGSGDGTSGGGASGGGDSSEGVKYDVGDGTGDAAPCDPNAGEDCGCTQVDVLFVLDNSSSMSEDHQQLAGVFPQFVDALVANLPVGTDLHVGITTSTFESTGQGSGGDQYCMTLDSDAKLEGLFTPPDTPFPGNGYQGRLVQYGGQAFASFDTSGDPTALNDWFVGAARSVGSTGSAYEMVSAGAAHVGHPANAGTNAGFLRDEGTVLVIFLVTDFVGNSPGGAARYHDMIVQQKAACGGDACVIIGGLVPPCVLATPNNVLGDFLHSFGSAPITGDIEGDPADFADVLGTTLAEVVGTTCDAIPPVG